METRTRTALTWIDQHARPITSLSPDAPFSELEPLRERARDATVVGLGTSTRGAHELFALQHRLTAYLVEDLGYRALALEEDWTVGLLLDEYLRTGTGDPRELLTEAWLPWQVEEMHELLVWLRAFNERHPGDPVRLVGVDFSATRATAYDAVTEHVREAAPERLAELQEHIAAIRPTGDIDEHAARFRGLDDRRPCLDHAERAYELVAGLPDSDAQALALHHARTILDFYRFHAEAPIDMGYVERRLAENALWWHRHTGRKVVYWGGIAHTSVGDPIVNGPYRRRNTGGVLRAELGTGYVSVGLTFDHGAVHAGVAVPPLRADWADEPLAAAGPERYLLDLRDAPAEFSVPGKARVIGPGYRAADDDRHAQTGGSLTDWFDVVVHAREVTPARPLARTS